VEQHDKETLLNKIAKAEKIFCEYNEYEHLYSSLVFLGNYTILSGAADSRLIEAIPTLEFDNSKVFETNLRKIGNHLSNIFYLILRLDSYKNKTLSELPDCWRSFIGLDIEFFHIQIRSIMDFIPSIIDTTFSVEAPEKKIDSYNRFLIWLENTDKKEKIQKIDPEIINLIDNSKDYFNFQKNVRDSLIHDAVDSSVFGTDTTEGILFNLNKSPFRTLINSQYIKQFFPVIKYNDNNVFYFEYYASIQLLELICFLEDFCDFYIKKYSIKNTGSPRQEGSGITKTKEWIDNLKTKIIQDNWMR